MVATLGEEESKLAHFFVPRCTKTRQALAGKIESQAQWVFGPNQRGEYVGLVEGGPVWKTPADWTTYLESSVKDELDRRAKDGNAEAGLLLCQEKMHKLDFSDWQLLPSSIVQAQ